MYDLRFNIVLVFRVLTPSFPSPFALKLVVRKRYCYDNGEMSGKIQGKHREFFCWTSLATLCGWLTVTEINSPWKAERVVGDEAANMAAVVSATQRTTADTAVDRWRFV